MSPETLAAFARVMFATFGGYVMSRPQLLAGTLSPPSAVVKSRSAADRTRFSVRRRILPPPGTIPTLLTFAYRGEGGVKNWQKNADVIYDSSLSKRPDFVGAGTKSKSA